MNSHGKFLFLKTPTTPPSCPRDCVLQLWRIYSKDALLALRWPWDVQYSAVGSVRAGKSGENVGPAKASGPWSAAADADEIWLPGLSFPSLLLTFPPCTSKAIFSAGCDWTSWETLELEPTNAPSAYASCAVWRLYCRAEPFVEEKEEAETSALTRRDATRWKCRVATTKHGQSALIALTSLCHLGDYNIPELTGND